MTYGEILIYSGVGLLAFTLILAIVFRVTKKDYRPPEDSSRAAPVSDFTAPLRDTDKSAATEPLVSGTPSTPMAGGTSLFHRNASRKGG